MKQLCLLINDTCIGSDGRCNFENLPPWFQENYNALAASCFFSII